MSLERTLEVPHPGPLAVALVPGRDGVAQLMQLHPTLALARPDVGQGTAQLGVPQSGGRSSSATTMPT